MHPTVDQVLNEHARRQGERLSDIRRCAAILEPVSSLIDALVAAAEAHGNGQADWTVIHDRIFSRDERGIAPTVYRTLDDAGIGFPPYEHPDGSCEEVAFAWIRAFRSAMERVHTRLAETTVRATALQDDEPLRDAA